MEPIRVLYIMGYGRSGSTLLDTVLGNHPQAESVGELANFHRARANGEFCACRHKANECPFWTEVWRRWQEVVGEETSRYHELQMSFERLRYMPRLILGSTLGSSGLKRYREWTRALFEAIAAVSGQQVIVDSSKNPGRGLALAGTPGLDVRLIHLVRDCRGVAYSRSKQFKRSVEAGLEKEIRPVSARSTAISWVGFNGFSSLIRRLGHSGRGMLLRYEDLVSDPLPTLDAIAAVTDLDMGSLQKKLADGESFEFGHTVSGNRVRMTGSLRLRPDLAWTQEMPEDARKAVWRVSGPLMRSYGYKRVGSS